MDVLYALLTVGQEGWAHLPRIDGEKPAPNSGRRPEPGDAVSAGAADLTAGKRS
jgi:hypothetical protein